jgi:hypothetical protein
MAYRPTNNIQENIIHRNTIFDSQGFVSCCTCGYCIKKTEDATLLITNFKQAQPIINEQSIGSTIIEFSDYMIPASNSSFGEYVLTPTPISQSVIPKGLADSLTYYPFLNCNGETTERATVYQNPYGTYSSYWKLVPSGEKTAYPYDVAVIPGTTGFKEQLPYPYYWGINFFSSTTYLRKDIFIGGDDSGSYDNYLDYISSHDFSVEGLNPNTSCSNNIVKIIDPVFYLDVSGYSFSYTHPNYSFVDSIENIYTGPDVISTVCSGTDSFNWSYDFLSRSNKPIYKDGYVLNNFTIDKNGSFTSKITLINTNNVNYSSYLQIENPPWWIRTQITSVDVIPAYVSAISSTYLDDQTLSSYSKNGSFVDVIPNQTWPYYYNFCGDPTEVFFGIKTIDVFGTFYDYPTQPALPINYIASKTNRTQITSTTNATGRTTLTIKNVLWTGKTLLTNNYIHDLGADRPNLASGKVPLNYQAILKGGFESDIEISFQSVPYCNLINIPDRLKRVTELKVNFENYEKIPQYNMLKYYQALNYFEATPLIGDPFYTEEAFNNFMVQMAFTYALYGRSSFDNFQYSFYGIEEFENIAFLPPNVNQNNDFFVRKSSNSGVFNIIKKDIIEIDPPELASYTATPGRVYPDFDVPSRFKSCLLINGDSDVWKTGNEVKFGSGTTVYYSIYIEEIKDEKQTAGQSLIRIATTLEDANDGIYIPNVGLEDQFKNKTLTVKFLSKYKDVSKENLPRYENVNPNNIDITNVNADILGASYSSSINYPTSFNSKFDFSFSTSGTGGFYTDYRLLSIKFYMPATFPDNPIYLENFQFEGPFWYTPQNVNQNFEVISLSPLKIKYHQIKFDNYHNTNAATHYSNFYYNFPRTNINVTFPWSDIESNIGGALFFGFQCDVIIEEVVDEFIQEALPIEFNQILENVEYIQTSSLMNSRKPMEMINPEQCEHIGKVIDRKDCNCPKKWVRLCDVHGETDWKTCMQCKDFKMSE